LRCGTARRRRGAHPRGIRDVRRHCHDIVCRIGWRDGNHDHHPSVHVHVDGIVVAVHRVSELRQFIFSEYRQRRLMTLAASRGAALGTSMHVVVTDPRALDMATAAVAEVVAAIDVACSRFRDDSELSRLQAGDGRSEGIVSPLLALALATALRAAELTGGAVDPTVGEAVRNAGYDVDFESVAADGAPLRLAVVAVPGWQRIRLYPATRRVEIDAGVEVDLGATAKALAADLAAVAARDAMGSGGVLVSLGGDVSVAGDAPDEGWHVQIAEDSRAAITPDGETIAIREGGVATSSTTVRRWRRGGVELHHIIDPSTGLPATGSWRTVSVVAGTCVDANIAATAAIVRGATAAAWLDAARLPARLVDRSGAMTRVGGWPLPGAQTS
jgi:thiamine biosynthesis lipoprotein ApbE